MTYFLSPKYDRHWHHWWVIWWHSSCVFRNLGSTWSWFHDFRNLTYWINVTVVDINVNCWRHCRDVMWTQRDKSSTIMISMNMSSVSLSCWKTHLHLAPKVSVIVEIATCYDTAWSYSHTLDLFSKCETGRPDRVFVDIMTLFEKQTNNRRNLSDWIANEIV